MITVNQNKHLASLMSRLTEKLQEETTVFIHL